VLGSACIADYNALVTDFQVGIKHVTSLEAVMSLQTKRMA